MNREKYNKYHREYFQRKMSMVSDEEKQELLKKWRDAGKLRRQKKKEYQDRIKANYPEKYLANVKLNRAVMSGLISKPSNCNKCCAHGKIEGHHPDYSKPLKVIWLCTSCHKELHRLKREQQRLLCK